MLQCNNQSKSHQTADSVRLCDLLEIGANVDAPQLEKGMDLASEINTELAKYTSQIYAKGGPELPVDDAQEKLMELVIYGNKVPAVAEFLQQLFQSGAPVICGSVDPDGPDLSRKRNFRFHLDERVERVLHACRTGDFSSWRIRPIAPRGNAVKGVDSATDAWTADIQGGSRFAFPLLNY